MKRSRTGTHGVRTLRARPVDTTAGPGWFTRAYARFAASRIAGFVSRRLAWKLDPLLLRLTRGRVATTLIFPTAVLETTGARTGARRRNAVIYFSDGDRTIIVASNAGSATDPAWYHNLRAHPDVVLGGAPMRAAAVVDAGERERLWPLADHVFPAYAAYRAQARRAGRTVPIVALTPRATP
ncbi:nitroreductase/quinone reductase family protein [Nocardia thailandica]